MNTTDSNQTLPWGEKQRNHEVWKSSDVFHPLGLSASADSLLQPQDSRSPKALGGGGGGDESAWKPAGATLGTSER